MSELSELKDLILNGGIRSRRWLPLREAALYCGLVDPNKPDTRCRSFLKFCQAEGITYKQGTGGKYDKLFDVVELDKAMTRDRKAVAA